MKNNYSDDGLRVIMSAASIRNEVIDTRIVETLNDIKKKKTKKSGQEKRTHKRTVWRKIAYGLGTVAAVFLVSIGICVANPSMAENIPILGNVFAKVQDIFSFGRIPEDEMTRLYDNVTDTHQNVNDNPYVIVDSDPNYLYKAQDAGIAVTITEYYASNQAVFFGVVIESEEEFPPFAVMGDTGYQLIQAFTRERYSFRDTEVGGVRNIEGRLEDAHTFAGIMRVDYDDINIDDSKYEAACREAEAKGEELPAVTEATWDLYYERLEVPEEFDAQIAIESLRGYCKEEIDAENGNQYRVRGNWEFQSFTIEKSGADVQTIQIDEVNEQGIGLEMIEISPVELTLHTVEPPDCLTFAVALDKDGRKLTSSSSNAYELAITGHDISTVTVYICDYDEYMDEIKMYALEDEENSMLEERALFKKAVDTR
ncbi:MAG: DUF4179 domain-containing protein [Lachnospiraceae bacterium]|nr:DUF4179 domain-containing protein [Lachnospiraceae bacterium]